MKNIEIVCRHGDMFVLVAQETPKGEKIDTKCLNIGYGTVTGHSHEIYPIENGGVSYFTEDKNADVPEIESLYFEVSGDGAILAHEQHWVKTLEPGIYVRTFQWIENPFTRMSEKVRD